MIDMTKLSFRQILRIAALEAASRVLQGSNATPDALMSHAQELEEYIGWGAGEDSLGEPDEDSLGEER